MNGHRPAAKDSTPAARSLTDSPWFWIEIFSVMALAAIVAIGPKYVRRQGQIERRFEGRQHAYSPAGQRTTEQVESGPLSEREPIISLTPLLVAVGTIMVVSHICLLRQRLRSRPAGKLDGSEEP